MACSSSCLRAVRGLVGQWAPPSISWAPFSWASSVMVMAQFVAFAWRYILPGRAGGEPPNRPA
jgi:hypothetical protein